MFGLKLFFHLTHFYTAVALDTSERACGEHDDECEETRQIKSAVHNRQKGLLSVRLQPVQTHRWGSVRLSLSGVGALQAAKWVPSIQRSCCDNNEG